jgi:cytochrome b pre-mRNA-processing protein 3
LFSGLFRRRPAPTTEAAYAAIVAQARQPAFYLAFAVPDTVKGRFDLIVAHLAVYCGRLESAGAGERAAMQAVVDRFFADLEDSIREMGVTDTGVPRKMKAMASAWLGRVGAYGPPLAAGDAAPLAAALSRNLFAEAVATDPDAARLGAAALARYMMAAKAAFAATAVETIVAGQLPWPDPFLFAPDTAGAAQSPRGEETAS